ncbi:hypothetical protein BDA99DRAFT_275113 [Phascolomyces articulosus]|uniref:F-box protein n=1 Tax=Phascolomyces articulosus TaxID=60185 RepID=A0AAD5K796_9FUNG|nr:hypothetical protein BDA99DRAFT_275113 [Phascolomyces articulosus]
MESECYYHNTCHGLESLSIDEDSLHNAAFPLLHKQLATLQLLRIYNYERGGVGVSIQANKIEALSTFLFPNLTILYLDRISSMLSQKLDSLIKQTPNLEKLFLNTVYNVPNGIFQCLLLLPRFSTLSMTEVEFDAHDLYQCLKGFSQRQVESSSGYLTHLSLSMCLINNAIMNVATKIQTLTNLDVSMFDIDGTPTDKAVMNFVEHITQLPKLNTLGISCWRIKMDHIQILSRCTSLRKISLWLMEDVNESQVRQAFSSDVQVEFYNWKNRWLFY